MNTFIKEFETVWLITSQDLRTPGCSTTKLESMSLEIRVLVFFILLFYDLPQFDFFIFFGNGDADIEMQAREREILIVSVFKAKHIIGVKINYSCLVRAK